MKIEFISTIFLSIMTLQGCHTYVINKDSAARQMTNLKIEKRPSANLIVVGPGGPDYQNNLEFLIVKNDQSKVDTILPFNIKFFLESGVNTGYMDPSTVIFK